jgi:Uma2 family endonuclease
MSTTRIQIGPADHGRSMTLEEFLEAEEEPGYRYELARGVLEVTEVPNDPHGQIVDNLREALSAYRRGHRGLIRRIGHAGEVRLIIPGLGSDRNPDLAIVFSDAPLDNRRRRVPALAVEVVSTGAAARQRDYEEKREEYLAFGLREYWIVDPKDRTVTVLSRGETSDITWSERVFRDGETIISGLLPGFAGTVAELWVDVEPETSGEGGGA